MLDVIAKANFDRFAFRFEISPLAFVHHAVWIVGFALFRVEVDVVICEHHMPADVTVVSKQCDLNEWQVVAIEIEAVEVTCASYQIDGSKPMCGSFASNAPPLVVRDGPSTQELLPRLIAKQIGYFLPLFDEGLEDGDLLCCGAGADFGGHMPRSRSSASASTGFHDR